MNPFNTSNPARLDRRATLQARTISRDAGGGVVSSFADTATVWAEWSPTPGREAQEAGQFLALAAGVLRIRHRTDITADWRVVLGGQYFEIAAPPVEVGRRVYLDLVLRSIVTPADASNAITDEAGNEITDESGVAITS